jgi:predicted site-specific integrase-resolvase
MNNEKKEAQFITVGNAAIISGLNIQTIRKLADSAQIDGYKTPSGQRRINRNSLQKLCYNDLSNQSEQISQKQNFIYTRVSTKKQLDDLSRQVEYVSRPEYSGYTLIKDIGSGINFKRKGLQAILDACLHRTIGEVIVAHRDRLSRFGFDLIEIIVTKAGGCITVLDCEKNRSSEHELSQDLLSIIHIFNCRQMGKRSYKKKQIQIDKNKDLSNENTEDRIE